MIKKGIEKSSMGGELHKKFRQDNRKQKIHSQGYFLWDYCLTVFLK